MLIAHKSKIQFRVMQTYTSEKLYVAAYKIASNIQDEVSRNEAMSQLIRALNGKDDAVAQEILQKIAEP